MASPSLNALFPQKSISPNKMIYHISRKRTEPRWVGGRGEGGQWCFVACPAGFSSFCDSLFSPKIGGGGCPPGPSPRSATGLTNSMMIGASPLWAYDWSVSFSKMISLRQYVRVTLSSAVASMDHSTCPVFSKLCSESQDYFDRSRWASISGGLR